MECQSEKNNNSNELSFALSWLSGSSRQSLAASAVVEFSTDKTEVKKDETVTVVCRVTSKDGFNDVKMKVSYDSDVLQFIEAVKK